MATDAPPRERVVVATYNVHGCVGRDGRRDPGRIAEVLAELEADVIGLQEVESRAHVEDGVDQFAYLARASGLRAVEGPTLHAHRGHYGNALLTRLPIRSVRRHDLSVVRREPRGLLDVELETGSGALRVLATHLGLRRFERMAQVERITAAVGDPGERPIVLLGDMNAWIPFSPSLRRLRRVFERGPRVRSFPAWRPFLPLDRVWTHPAGALLDVRAHRTPLARVASDHLPVVGEIALG